MGIVETEITLKNAYDEIEALNGKIKPENVRAMTVKAVVDTGALNLLITEELRQKLGLRVAGEKTAHIANGQRFVCKMTEAVNVHWKDRDTLVPAMVIPGAEKVLLGAIPLEGMDLMVNPVTREVTGVHGDKVECLAVSLLD